MSILVVAGVAGVVSVMGLNRPASRPIPTPLPPMREVAPEMAPGGLLNPEVAEKGGEVSSDDRR